MIAMKFVKTKEIEKKEINMSEASSPSKKKKFNTVIQQIEKLTQQVMDAQMAKKTI